jgi:hypothetical protein
MVKSNDSHKDITHTPPILQKEDRPTYYKFNLEHPILSGMGSVLNIFGNYYSFDDYLSQTDDSNDIASDFETVGAALWKAMS